jgi:hypothetical protein
MNDIPNILTDVISLQVPTVQWYSEEYDDDFDSEVFIEHLGDTSFFIPKTKTILINTFTPQESFTEIMEWYKKQQEYILGLSYLDKIILLSYTFHGDKVSNAWFRNKFSVEKLREFFTDSAIESEDFMPLASTIYKKIRLTLSGALPRTVKLSLNSRNFKYTPQWAENFSKIFSESSPDSFMEDEELGSESYTAEDDRMSVYFSTLEDLKKRVLEDLTFIQKSKVFNTEVYKKICSLELFFTDNFLTDVVKEYSQNLNKIISEAPPVTTDFNVFRGIKAAYVPVDEHTYRNVDLLSTSISFDVAMKFVEYEERGKMTSCCVKNYLLKKGTPCIAIESFSFIESEHEILIPVGTEIKILNKIPVLRNYVYENLTIGKGMEIVMGTIYGEVG